MKSKLILFLALLLSFGSIAQQTINYKALIKDNLGNVISNQSVTIQFTILQGAAETTVYQEDHIVNTDANGIAIVNVGAGNILNGDYNTIDWGSDDHFLNVQIDTGSGLTDMGTTQFKAVPYALYAETSGSGIEASGLEAIDEGNGIGWRLVGSNPNVVPILGNASMDLTTNMNATFFGLSDVSNFIIGSHGFQAGNTNLAIGENSVALGIANFSDGFASISLGSYNYSFGENSISLGSNNNASGDFSVAFGYNNQALGSDSFAFGKGTTADDNSSTVIGKFNDENELSNVLFQVGNGTNSNSKSNAFNIDTNGIITAPSFDIAEITAPKALITKEYLEANGSTSTGLEAIDEGNGIGWRLIGGNPNVVPILGNASMDLTTNMNAAFFGLSDVSNFTIGSNGFQAGNTNLALGDNSVSLGIANFSSGLSSIGLGSYNYAYGENSISIGSDNNASGDFSVALGFNNQASGSDSFAFGKGTNADDNSSIVIGKYNDETELSNVIFQVGNGTNSNSRSNALNIDTNGIITAPSFDIAEITAPKALITKEYLEANGSASTGLEALDEGNGLGWRLIGKNPNSFGNIGQNAVDLSDYFGASDTRGATGYRSFASGYGSTASGDNATALGFNTEANQIYATAMGRQTLASGASATAMGYLSTASGSNSTAMGSNTEASGENATALGHLSIASAYNSLAAGTQSVASQPYSMAIGHEAIADYQNAVAIGRAVTSSGYASVAMGTNTTASGAEAFAMGNANTATGGRAVSLGFQNNVTSDYSFAMGNSVNVSGFTSGAVGYFLNNDEQSSFLVGRFNDNTTDSGALFMVGNGGGDTSRSNAFMVYQNGNAFLSGNLTQSSDGRLKQEINELDYGLSEVMKLKPVSYHWKKHPNQPKSLGLIAQEIQPIIKEIVHVAEDKDQTLSVSYTELIPVLIRAIQEQQAIIDRQAKTIQNQETAGRDQAMLLQTLLDRVEALEKNNTATTMELVKN